MSAREWKPFTALASRSMRADLAFVALRQQYDMDHEDERIRMAGTSRFVAEVLAILPIGERKKVMLGVGMIDHIEE